jgi:L-alanine-DL-glutamate epimerase-like enolase superfamily enzyme
VAIDPPRRIEGWIRSSRGPGLGIDIDEESLGAPILIVR